MKKPYTIIAAIIFLVTAGMAAIPAAAEVGVPDTEIDIGHTGPLSGPARTQAGVKRLQESIGMFAWLGGVGPSPGLAVMDYLVQREITWVGPFSGSTVWYDPPKKTVFSLYPPYWFEAEALCEYAVEH